MDQGNTAFLLISAALVLLMTPGLAFFYGGLVKAKSVISMMMLSFGAMGLIGVLWVLYGYAIIHVSIGGVLSGLSMASVFPFEAYAVIGFGILGLPIIERRLTRAGGGVEA